MNFYKLIRSVHPEKDIGKEMAVDFNLGAIKSAKYGEAIIKGHFLCALPLGYFPKISHEQLENADKTILDYAIQLGLLKKGDKYYENFLKIGIGKAVILFSPDVDNSKLIAYFYIFFFFIDDLISNYKFFNQDASYSPPTYQQLKEILEAFILVIQGHYSYIDTTPNLDFPPFKPLCKLLLRIRQEALLSKANNSYFLDELVKYIRAVLCEREYKEKNGRKKSYTTEEYMFLRHWEVAVHPTVEVINLAKAIVLSEDIRKHPLFERVFYQVCIQIALMNDVLSLRKEVLNDEYLTDNLVIINLKRFPLQKSINQVVKKTNLFLMDLKRNILRLLDCFPSDINLNRFIETLAYVVDGNIYWHQQSHRYGDFKYHYYTIKYTSSWKVVPFSQKMLDSIPPAIEKSFLFQGTSNPIANGLRFLENTCSSISCFQSRIGETRELVNAAFCPYKEVYSSAIILDLLQNMPINSKLSSFLEKFLTNQYNRWTFNFFTQQGLLPDDVDDTSLCLLALFKATIINLEILKEVGKLILSNCNEEGIIQVYFPPRGERENRIDASICACAMRLIYQTGLDATAKQTEDYLYDVLTSKSYLQGNWYYHAPDAFLYYLAKAVVLSPRARERFSNLLVKNIQERLGTTKYPLDLAMRILAITTLKPAVDDLLLEKLDAEKYQLESLQQKDGSWPKDALYKAGRSNIYFGSQEISTAFAVSALNAYQICPIYQIGAL